LVFANPPVHQVVLPIHTEIESADGEVSQGVLAVGGKYLALTMEKVEAVVEGMGVDVILRTVVA
jgi:hypothetical protein